MIARLFDRRWRGLIVLALGCACMRSPGSVSAAGDDTYRFVAGVSEVLPLELSPTAKGIGWTWSEPATKGWDTALLGLRVATGEGEPWVEFSAGPARVRQYLDPGASGLRWLTLNGLKAQLSPGTATQVRIGPVSPAARRASASSMTATPSQSAPPSRAARATSTIPWP